MGKYVTITEDNGISNVGISQIQQGDIGLLSGEVKTEIMIHALKLDYNIIMEKMVKGLNVPIDTFSLTDTIIENCHVAYFVGDSIAEVERNAKVLGKILYSELLRVGMQVAKRSTYDVQIPDIFVNELENIALKSLKILL